MDTRKNEGFTTLYNVTPSGEPYQKEFPTPSAIKLMAMENNGGWSSTPIPTTTQTKSQEEE